MLSDKDLQGFDVVALDVLYFVGCGSRGCGDLTFSNYE